MNCFTSRIVNDEDRRRIASRAPIDVFIPSGEDEQYVSNTTGNYWPFRTLRVTDIQDNEGIAKRTQQRITKLGIIDTRPPGSNFPHDLYACGEEFGADFVCPVTYTGTSRDAIAYPVMTYNEYDFTHRPELFTPVPHPYELTIPCIEHGLYDGDSEPTEYRGISPGTATHPTAFLLRDLRPHVTSWGSLRTVIERLRTAVPGDVAVYLHEPVITGDLIRYIRSNPGTINGIILPREDKALYTTGTEVDDGSFEDDSTALLKKTFSKPGRDRLRDDLSPYVRVASELSLLTSTFIEPESNRELQALIQESVIPVGTESVQPVTDVEADQGTLTGMFSD